MTTTTPKMHAVAETIKAKIDGTAPFMSVLAADNLMSSVTIRGAFEPKDDWANGIFHNANYFIFHVVSPKYKRWYDETDETATVELISKGHKLPTFRKYTGPVAKVAEKIEKWLKSAKPA